MFQDVSNQEVLRLHNEGVRTDSEVVKIRGFRVDTDGLESLLMKAPGIKASRHRLLMLTTQTSLFVFQKLNFLVTSASL